METESKMLFSDDPSDFVSVKEVVSDAILDIRYYSANNFIGDRVDGYEQEVALLTKEAAAALKKAGEEIRNRGLCFKIYDAYRPQMAVDHFVRWGGDLSDVRMKEYYYPDVSKEDLFKLGFIAKHSGHSRGSTVDLSLYDTVNGADIDMGGTFDFFGEISHSDYGKLSVEQLNNRRSLREVMMDHGFIPLKEEWWHYTLKDEPYPDTYFTFPNRALHTDMIGNKDIISLIEDAGIEYVDLRDKKGALWIVGGEELQEFADSCNRFGYEFAFTPTGGKATDRRPGWWLKRGGK